MVGGSRLRRGVVRPPRLPPAVHVSGSQGRYGQHARADCPSCGRNIAGGVDHETGHIILRYHKRQPGGPWCSGRSRVDAGPASPVLDAAYRISRDAR